MNDTDLITNACVQLSTCRLNLDLASSYITKTDLEKAARSINDAIERAKRCKGFILRVGEDA